MQRRLEIPNCSVTECAEITVTRGLCREHYRAYIKENPLRPRSAIETLGLLIATAFSIVWFLVLGFLGAIMFATIVGIIPGIGAIVLAGLPGLACGKAWSK